MQIFLVAPLFLQQLMPPFLHFQRARVLNRWTGLRKFISFIIFPKLFMSPPLLSAWNISHLEILSSLKSLRYTWVKVFLLQFFPLTNGCTPCQCEEVKSHNNSMKCGSDNGLLCFRVVSLNRNIIGQFKKVFFF